MTQFCLVLVIMAMLFAMPWYIHHDYQSSTDPRAHDQNVEIVFLDDVSVTQGSKMNDCKEPTPFPPENTDLNAKHPWHNSLSMPLVQSQ